MDKFTTIDEAYLAARRALAAHYGPQDLWWAVDAFPLYCGTQTLARTLVLSDLVKQTLAVPGDVLEFGSWRGSTLLLFAKVLHLLAPHSPKVVHGFDLWDRGFAPEQWRPEDNPDAAREFSGTYAGEPGVIHDMLRLYGLTDTVRLHQGKIEETWPALLAAEPGLRVSLVLCDVDLYEPTVAALTGLHPRLSVGGIIAWDEYAHPSWPGETLAADQFLAAHEGCYSRGWEPLYARQPSLIVRKIRA